MRQTYDTQSPDKKHKFKHKQELNATMSAAVEAALDTCKDKKRKIQINNQAKEFNLSSTDGSNSSTSISSNDST